MHIFGGVNILAGGIFLCLMSVATEAMPMPDGSPIRTMRIYRQELVNSETIRRLVEGICLAYQQQQQQASMGQAPIGRPQRTAFERGDFCDDDEYRRILESFQDQALQNVDTGEHSAQVIENGTSAAELDESIDRIESRAAEASKASAGGGGGGAIRRDQADECPACFESLEGERNLLLECGHEYHIKCLILWAKSRRQSNQAEPVNCPICRSPVRYRDGEEVFE